MALKRLRGSNKTQGLCKLAIDEAMTIYEIGELKEKLGEDISGYERFELDLGKVEDIDSAGIQLLVAFSNELAHANKGFIVTAMSPAVNTLVTTYGLSFNKEQSA